MKKTIGYCLFAFLYYLCKPLPIKKKKVLCIMTHDDGEGSNVSLTVKALKQLDKGYTFSFITKKETLEVKGFQSLPGLLSFFFRNPYQLARAEIILMDNVFLPFAYLKVKKGVKVIQLWHGTGTIKKFGQDVNTGKLKEQEYRANQNITHLIVNSEETKQRYSKVFGVREELIYPIGLPKTDELIRRLQESELRHRNPDKEVIYQKYRIPKDKKLILYAPTFRDNEAGKPEVLLKLEDILRGLPEDYYLGLRLHPFIAGICAGQMLPDRVISLSFESDVNSVIMASDALVTDYSSIIFEYCLTGRPMVFFAYDLIEFSDHGRGFYYKYEDYVPGPVVCKGEEAAALLRENRFDLNRIHTFRERNFSYMDGNATERLLILIQQEDNL